MNVDALAQQPGLADPLGTPADPAAADAERARHVPESLFAFRRAPGGAYSWRFNEGSLAKDFDGPGLPIFLRDARSQVEAALDGKPVTFLSHVDKRLFKTRLQPMDEEAGRLVVGATVEITGRPQADEELRALREVSRKLNDELAIRVLELSRVNEELGTFSYTVSHDLRTPMTIIENYAHIMQSTQKAVLDETGQAALAGLRKAVARMALLVENVLRLSRVGRAELNRQNLDLADIAQEIVRELREQDAQRTVDVRIAHPMPAHADPHIIRIALANLLGNAWKYTRFEPRARIEVATQERDGRPVFVVRDNGVGFDRSDADKVFRLFERAATAAGFEGTGIGLATAQRAIQRHGGSIWADAEPGKGASFYFTLGKDTQEAPEVAR